MWKMWKKHTHSIRGKGKKTEMKKIEEKKA